MKTGFLTAALPDMTLEDLLKWGSEKGFQMIEVATWPTSYEERRYAGTQHIDTENMDSKKAEEINNLLDKYNMEISSLAYYPNPLDPDPEARAQASKHLKTVMNAANLLGVDIVGTFVGRDKDKGIEESLDQYEEVFTDLVKYAEDKKVKLAIENCPMLYADRWPGGNNLAYSPEIWNEMFTRIDSDYLGLNYDPSHLIWQQIDYVQAVFDFKDKIFHTHAKDTKMDYEALSRKGIYGFGFFKDKIAGLGDINWRDYLGALYEIGYDGVVSVEHEDRGWEKDQQNILDGIFLAKKLISKYFIK